jgi:hypothetical protein
MTNKELNQQESLRLIEQMIDKAKKSASDNSFHFLVWGILVIVASISQYFMLTSGMGYETNWIWPGIVVIGLPVTFIYEWRRSRRQKAMSYNDRLVSMLWLAFGVTLIILILIAVFGYQINPIPFILALVGMVTFFSGVMIRFRPLIIGGIVFWSFSAASYFVNGAGLLLLNAAAILLGYIIPGLLLNKKTREQNHV